jgi:hypothetical protein
MRALTSQTMDPITRAILVKELKALEIDVRARPFDTVFRVGRTSATLRKSSWKVTFFAGRRRPAAIDGRNFASFAGFAGGAAGGILAPEKGHGLSDRPSCYPARNRNRADARRPTSPCRGLAHAAAVPASGRCLELLCSQLRARAPGADAISGEPTRQLEVQRVRPGAFYQRGTIASTIREGRSRSWNTVCSARRSSALSPKAAPVFGLRSKRGKLLLEISTRMRCPAAN